ncbi:MAG: hypothetical protein PHV36_08270 [Elusimicrobiales bacterium]|nr:hypothetical protein [Elusimicrobiales bacterium]
MKTLSLYTGAMSLAVFLSILPPARAAAGNQWTGNANLLLGAKALDKNDWEPANEQGEAGVETDFRRRDWPLSVAIDVLGAAGEGKIYDPFFGEAKMQSETSELCLGVRKVWDGSPSVRPFIGGGISMIKATARVTVLGVTVEDSGSGTGSWLGGGVYWTLGDSFNIGFEFRTSSGKAKLFGQEIKAGGGHGGLLVGYHWGGSAKKKDEDRQERPARVPAYEEPESGALELEKQKLEIEKQKLDLEKAKFEFEKQKAGGK